jgi:hypothetical protein
VSALVDASAGGKDTTPMWWSLFLAEVQIAAAAALLLHGLMPIAVTTVAAGVLVGVACIVLTHRLHLAGLFAAGASPLLVVGLLALAYVAEWTLVKRVDTSVVTTLITIVSVTLTLVPRPDLSMPRHLTGGPLLMTVGGLALLGLLVELGRNLPVVPPERGAAVYWLGDPSTSPRLDSDSLQLAIDAGTDGIPASIISVRDDRGGRAVTAVPALRPGGHLDIRLGLPPAHACVHSVTMTYEVFGRQVRQLQRRVVGRLCTGSPSS